MTTSDSDLALLESRLFLPERPELARVRAALSPITPLALALAADSAGVARAEALTREFAARLAPFGARVPERCEWNCAPSPTKLGTMGGPFELAGDAVEVALDEIPMDSETLRPVYPGLDYFVLRVVKLSRAWSIAVERRLDMSGAAWVPRALIGRRFAELADPFASLLALWRTGYWLDSSIDETTHTVRLLTPPPEDRDERR
ncbi:MAG TPA: hypothetical protein VHB97_22480 [Polyangia bacterium]|nr:hypothetical protein [Polyangia bacterium]